MAIHADLHQVSDISFTLRRLPPGDPFDIVFGAKLFDEAGLVKDILGFYNGDTYFPILFELDWLFALDAENNTDIPRTKKILHDIKVNGFNQIVMNVCWSGWLACKSPWENTTSILIISGSE